MTEQTATTYFESAADTPLTAPAALPTIRVRRVSDGALVVTDAALTDTGDGLYRYVYAGAAAGIEYQWRADGDPLVTGQTVAGGRYVAGVFAAAKAGQDLSAYNDGRLTAVHFDPAAGNTATVVGVDGTPGNPVSTEAAMLAIAAALGINAYNIHGTLTLTVGYGGAVFTAYGGGFPAVFTSGQSLDGASFDGNIGVIGDLAASSNVYFRDCLLVVKNHKGVAQQCFLQGVMSVRTGASYMDCRALIGAAGAAVDIDFTGVGGQVAFHTLAGHVRFLNIGAGALIEVSMIGGRVELDASCVAGDLLLSGTATLVDNSAGTVVDATSLLSGRTKEIHRYLGLEQGTPVIHDPTSIVAGDITQTVVTVGPTVTKTRT